MCLVIILEPLLGISTILEELFGNLFICYNIGMSEDQFTKLFLYMQEFRQEVDGRFNEHDKRFDDLTNL